MRMQSTYGVFDNEANHIISKIRNHAALDEILAIKCPACDSDIQIIFDSDGSGFSVNCTGDPLHITKHQNITNPPIWWPLCFDEPSDIVWHWSEFHNYDDDGNLHMKISGWDAVGTRWSGAMDCKPGDPDYDLWRWILDQSDCVEPLISNQMLDQLRERHRNA